MEKNTSKLPSGEAKNNSSEQRQEEEANPNLNSVMAAIDSDSGEENPNSNSGEGGPVQSSRRTPFTNLSQIDADLALARTLQEQERAYMMLSAIPIGSDSGSWVGSYYEDDADNEVDFDEPGDEDGEGEEGDDRDRDREDEYNDTDDDEDAFDIHEHADDDEDDDNNSEVEIDPSAFSSDEAFARALQEAEERDLAARLLALAGINREHVDAEDIEDHGGNSQDAWEEVDPDELSYEELLALGEVVGTETRGLSADTIASLPSVNYKRESDQNGNGTGECCVICRLDYEDGETLTALACKHLYHTECIGNWLNINKVCPICNVEVSTSGHR